MKRTASSELVGRPSSFHSSVTLYTSSVDTSDSTSLAEPILRRSKRVKVKDETDAVTIPSKDVPTMRRQTKSKTAVAATSSAVKLEDIEVEDLKPPSTPLKKQASSRKPKAVKQALDVPHPTPLRWREAYDTINRMRSTIVAPVDTMGCDQAQYKEKDPKNQRFATLVSLMLSSQTKDEVTDAAVSKLRLAVGGSLTVDAILTADDTAISDAIAKVGFWRRKTQYIKQTAQRLRDDFDSDVPKTVDELCSLPGVGPKMAFLALQVAWNINVGIGVDVHVHRITNRLGWHKPLTKTPEETRLNLQSWLPTELHPEINHMLVGFGQMVCLPVGPRCDVCDLSSGLCPSARQVSKAKPSKVTETKTTAAGPKIEIAVETASEELDPLPLDAPSPLSEIED